MDKFRDQSIRFGTRVVTETVSRVDLSSRPFKYWSDDPEPNTADAIIIATGASAKRLGLKGEDVYWQSGISACAVCDGAVPIFRFVCVYSLRVFWCLDYVFIRNKPLAVIGGGDSAAEEATCTTKSSLSPSLPLIVHTYPSDLTKYASHVYVLVRRGELRASKIMAKRLKNHPKIVSLSSQSSQITQKKS